MATAQLHDLIGHIRTGFGGDGAGLGDGELLDAFVTGGDQRACAALVHRHGPMVWGVCRRLLHNLHDAEEAFQATFLVLVRKAGSIMPRHMVANWLYGVARQTALNARALAARKNEREKQVPCLPEPAAPENPVWQDLEGVLDGELSCLPGKYRVVLVLCDLEGKTRGQAARQLGVPEGTVAGQLARARAMLSKRLKRKGVALSCAALGAVLAQNAASAAPPVLVASTIKAAGLVGAGQLVAGELISVNVLTLTEGVLQAMLTTKLKMTAVFLGALCSLALGGAGLVYGLAGARTPVADAPGSPGAQRVPQLVLAGPLEAATSGLEELLLGQVRGPQAHEVRGVIKSVDGGSITVSTSAGRDDPPAEKSYALAKDVEVVVGAGFGAGAGGRFGGGGLFKEMKLADLAPGLIVSLTLSADQKQVESILADEPFLRGQVKAVDAQKKTLTVSTFPTRGRGEDAAPEDKTYEVAADAEIALDDGRGRRLSLKEGKLEDLTNGTLVNVRLSLDKKAVRGVHAEGPMLHGTVKALDAAKKTLTLVTRPPRGDEAAEERNLTVSPDAMVLIDDGKGRRLSIKQIKLQGVPVGSVAMAKLSTDQNFVMTLRVEGPMVIGLFKAADADKGIIVIALPPKERGAEPEEKTFKLAKDVHVNIDGVQAPLANLKAADNGPIVQLRLSLDQQVVQSVIARQPGARRE